MTENYYRGSNRIACPYEWCSATAKVVWSGRLGGGTDAIIAHHAIGHDALTGLCPASLMHMPLTNRSLNHLAEQADIQRRQVEEWLEERNRQRNIPQDYTSTATGIRHLYCMTDHGPGSPCPGRQNESQPVGEPWYTRSSPVGEVSSRDDPAWGLGGREDEDVIPHGENVVGTVPQGVVGMNLGASMSSIPELSGMAHSAIVEANGAVESLNSAIESLQRAEQSYAGILDGSTSDKIQTALSSMALAIKSAQEAKNAIAIGEEYAQSWINGLHS
jgi:hypothetical protein